MVTFNFQKLLHDGDRFLLYSKGVCMSGDEKPTEGIANGSELLEMDTSTKYKFNLANSQWVKVVGDCCGLAEEINRLSAIVPDPTSADTGKVLTASGEGTGSWEQASGGGGIDIILIDIASDETVTVTYNGQPITSHLDIPAGAVYSAFYRHSTLGEESENPYKQILEVDGYGQFVLQRTAGNQYPTGVANFYYFTDECVGLDILSGKWIHTYNRSNYIYYRGLS